MASQDVQRIREGYAALNRGDIEWLRAHVHPDFEFRSRFSALSGRSYTGERAFEQWFADVSESWESIEQIPERFVELDSERTAVEVRFKARGRGSGAEIDQLIGWSSPCATARPCAWRHTTRWIRPSAQAIDTEEARNRELTPRRREGTVGWLGTSDGLGGSWTWFNAPRFWPCPPCCRACLSRPSPPRAGPVRSH